jgi:hypothetical protein
MNFANYDTSTTYKWTGYESDSFTLPIGTHPYRLVYVWDPVVPLPCRYFTGRQWNGDNYTLSANPIEAPTTVFSPSGLLIYRLHVKCNDTLGGSVVTVPKCAAPSYPLPPSNPYFILFGGANSPDTSSNGIYSNLDPGFYLLRLMDSLTNSIVDSASFTINLVPKVIKDTTFTQCESYTWHGITYSQSGIYTDTSLGYYSPSSLYCPLVEILHLTIVPLPSLTITTGANTIIEGTSLAIQVNGAHSYNWMPGSFNGDSIVVTPLTTTTYTVTGTNSYGCTNTATITITVSQSTAGTAVQMTIKNLTNIQANIFEYEVFIKNTGTTSLALRSYSWGLNLQTGFANGGTITKL